MKHPEFYIYATSFVIFFTFFVFVAKKQGRAFFKEKQKRIDDFFKTARYLQRVSLDYIMQEKEPDGELKTALHEIRDETRSKIQEMERISEDAIDQQTKKLNQQFTSRMKIMNSRFINETKGQLTLSLMDEVKTELKGNVSS